VTTTYGQAALVPFNVANLRLSIEATRTNGLRITRTQFGDGYEQIIGDGLNAQSEKWSCKTAPMSANEAWGMEAFFLATRGKPFQWSAPDASKRFLAQFSNRKIVLGYRELTTVTLDSYPIGVAYTVDLLGGVITSLTIPDGVPVEVDLTQAPRAYLVTQPWTITQLGPDVFVASWEMTRVYV
jgi:phage-related protein